MLPLLPKFPEQGNLVITTGFNSNFGVVSSNWRLSAGNSREGVCLGATPGSNLTSLRRAEEGCALHLRTSHQSLGFPALSLHGSRRPLPPEGSSSAHLKLPPPWWGRREGRERPKLLAATGSPLPAVATVIAHRSTARCRHQQRLRGTGWTPSSPPAEVVFRLLAMGEVGFHFQPFHRPPCVALGKPGFGLTRGRRSPCKCRGCPAEAWGWEGELASSVTPGVPPPVLPISPAGSVTQQPSISEILP